MLLTLFLFLLSENPKDRRQESSRSSWDRYLHCHKHESKSIEKKRVLCNNLSRFCPVSICFHIIPSPIHTNSESRWEHLMKSPYAKLSFWFRNLENNWPLKNYFFYNLFMFVIIVAVFIYKFILYYNHSFPFILSSQLLLPPSLCPHTHSSSNSLQKRAGLPWVNKTWYIQLQ